MGSVNRIAKGHQVVLDFEWSTQHQMTNQPTPSMISPNKAPCISYALNLYFYSPEARALRGGLISIVTVERRFIVAPPDATVF